MKQSILTFIIVFLSLSFTQGQSNKNTLTEMKISGTVKSIIDKRYTPIVKSGETQKGKLISTTVYTFNDAGNQIENTTEEQDESNQKVITKTTFKYNTNGNVIESNTIQREKLTDKNIYKYNDKGHLTEYYVYNPDGSISNRFVYKNDANGNRIEEVQFLSDGSSMGKYTYKYDDKGNKIEWNSYNQDGSLFQKTYFKYDDKGNMIENGSYMNGKTSNKYTVKYDSNGNIIEQVNYDDNGKAYMKRVNKYESDKNSNWTKNVEFFNNTPSDFTERTIIY